MSEKFLNNRLKFHSASRVGIQEGESLLAAANKDQHTVDISSVWSSPIDDFPLNNTTYKETTNTSAATEDLIKVFTNNRTESESVKKTSFNGGVKWTNSNYPAVTLYENVLMTPVANSNGSGSLYESYEILTLNDKGEKVRLQDWVSPVAMFDPNIKKPIPGYTGKVEVYETGTNSWVEIQETAKSVITAARGSEWAANYGNWEFIYYAGIVTFNADYTPSRSSWIANFGKYSSSDLTNIPTSISDTADIINKVVKLRWTGFLYTGLYLDKKIANTFAGVTINPVNLDTYKTVGIYRIEDDDTLAGTKPPITSCTGFLQVMDINHDEDRTVNVGLVRIRQIIYPDKQDESSPYTRVGEASSVDGAITWSEWAMMGGGSLRRIVIDGTTGPQTISAVNNVLYESFGANTFTMPDPDTVPVGTRIGFEQFIGTATVTCGTLVQTLLADTPLGDYSSLPAADAISYIFECVISQDGSSREWMLDIDHNYAAAVDTLNDRIVAANDALNDLADHVDAIDLAAETLLARQTKHMICANDGYILTSTAPTADDKASDEAWQTFLNSSKFNLYFYDLICSVTVDEKTVTLPNTTVPGACVTVELLGGLTCTVTTADGSVSQSFTADANTILVLAFEYTRINASTNGWALLSLAADETLEN